MFSLVTSECLHCSDLSGSWCLDGALLGWRDEVTGKGEGEICVSLIQTSVLICSVLFVVWSLLLASF